MKAAIYLLVFLCSGVLSTASSAAQTSGQSWYGNSTFDEQGNEVTIFGDGNGDGYDDFAFSAFRADSNGTDSGRVVVISGATNQVLYELVGDSPYDYLGEDLAAAGDVNNDGHADFIVNANQWGHGLGYVRVFSGLDGSIIHEFTGTIQTNWFATVAGAGDVDLDGHDDLILAEANADTINGVESGEIKIRSGLTGAVLYTFLGDAAGDMFGYRVAPAGDVNADGWPDMVFSAPSYYVNNYVRVYSGRDGAELLTVHHGGYGDQFGTDLCGPGDLNGDGFDDLIVGDNLAYDAFHDGGKIYAVSGLDGTILYEVWGGTVVDNFGHAVSPAGDANHDGTPDFLVGAHQSTNYGPGYVRLCSGIDGSTLIQIYGDQDGELLGAAVDGTGDTNNDGWNDILAGAMYDDTNGTNSGEVRLITGFLLLASPHPGQPGRVNQVEVLRASPGDRIHFAHGTTPGLTAIPGCPGLSVEIDNAIYLGNSVAATNGHALLTAFVPSSVSGRTILIQAVERSNCLVSNLVTYTFP